MNTHHKRFLFEPAKPEDGQELLEILEEAPFKGNISLLYTRRPDAYHSLQREGEEVDIIVARDTENGRIAGFGACAIRTLHVNGEPERVGYLFGLRIAKAYLGKFPILHRGYGYLRELHTTKAISCYITTILEENVSAKKLLEKRRSFMPTYQPFGLYEIFAMRKISKTSPTSSLCFRQAQSDDLAGILNFLNAQNRHHQFSPVLMERDFQPESPLQLHVKDFYLLHNEQHEILAAGIPWNQQNYKQYVVQGYGGIFKILSPFSRLFPLVGFPALPASRSTLTFFTLSFWAVKENNPDFFIHFLHSLSQRFKQIYPFFLVGLHERHPLRHILQKQPHISYRSRVYLVLWKEQQDFAERLDRTRLPYFECGML